MADPYATRSPDLSGRPEGPPPWEPEVTRRGGSLIGPDGSFPAGSDFVVVPCRGIGTLAPVALLEPATAVLLWLEHCAEPREASAANALLAGLTGAERPILAIKQGAVGGPADRPGCTEVAPALVAAVLGALPDVRWEPDPDFGYRVPASVPGLGDPEARTLMPRLVYADNDRVYEHAGLVA
ncbi:MAG: hypothetical protein KDB46_12920, partial [Solirubrobacterales bacterium]|nr:hypothetical protein [Solirubrobacterales bacterium]